MTWKRLADWCVPSKALRLYWPTMDDIRRSNYYRFRGVA